MIVVTDASPLHYLILTSLSRMMVYYLRAECRYNPEKLSFIFWWIFGSFAYTALGLVLISELMGLFLSPIGRSSGTLGLEPDWRAWLGVPSWCR